MWFGFAISVLCGWALVLCPGFLFARALRLRADDSLRFGPLLSVGFYALMGTIFPILGIRVSGFILFCTVFVGCAALFSLSYVRARGQWPEGAYGSNDDSANMLGSSFGKAGWLDTWAPILLACAASGLVALCVYYVNIGAPDAFAQNYDNAFHLNRVKQFTDTGVYSSLAGGFYPSAWHVLAAMISSITGASVPAAANAANAAVFLLAYPLSMCALLSEVFRGNRRRIMLGCLACSAIAFFPWRIMLFGPLYPNVLAFSLMPAEAAIFIRLCSDGADLRSRVALAVLFIFGGVSLALAQPNAVFSIGVFLVPFCLKRAYEAVTRRVGGEGAFGAMAGIGASLLLLILFALAWCMLLKVPFLQGIVTYPRDTPLSVSKALRWALSLSFVIRRPQFFIAGAIVLGCLGLLREKGSRWVSASYVFMLALFVVGISGSGEVRQALVGFWYSDYHRLAAAASALAVLPAAAGLDLIVGACSSLAHRMCNRLGTSKRLTHVVSITCSVFALACLFALNAFPYGFVPYPIRSYGFDAVSFEIRDMYRVGVSRPLDANEIAFLHRVKAEVGDSCVLNQPYDGSVYAYAIDGVDVLFKQYNPPSSPDIQLVTGGMKDVARSSEVRGAAGRLGIRYVLLLDKGDGPHGFSSNGTFYPHGYLKEGWAGINGIDDGTPGFSTVISQGDMRLYKVDY